MRHARSARPFPGTASIVATATVALLSACGSPGVHHSLLGDPSPVGAALGTPATTLVAATDAPTTAAPTTLAPTTLGPTTAAPTTAAPDQRPARPYAVGTTGLDLTDTSRNADSQTGRHLPTVIFYPAVGNDPAPETASAPGLYRSWPLVIFAHGYNVTPLTYHDLLHHLAQSGFVVAAPSFPLETQGGPLDENDLRNEPGDIRYVITQVLAASGRSGVLSGLVDPGRIAVIGHSDGGEAALGVAYLAGESDNRIGPVVAMAAQAILNGDKVSAGPVRHSLLVVQGTADTINPPARADQVYASAPSPKAYLHLLGGGHLPPIVDNNQWRPVVEATVVDWLDAWFGPPNSVGVAARIGHDANVPGTASIQLG